MIHIISFKTMLAGVILSFSLLFSFYIISSAQNIFDIQFPVPELGNCGSMEECKIYCNDSANASACTEWATAKGFIKQTPEQRGPEMPTEQGPGGCASREECDIFCSKPENNKECFQFAKEHNMIPQEEIERMEKEMSREGPGGCRSREECDSFCRNPDNAATCLNFAVQEGKISQEEADFMVQRTKINQQSGQRRPGPPRPGQPQGPQIGEEKAKQLLETIGGPGGCKTMDECEVFCDNPENDNACFQYAVDNGLMPDNELQRIKKLKETPGPGGCLGRASCDAYCDDIDHAEECMQFAVDQGLMNQSQVEEAKKFIEIGKRGGPGGCRGQRECDAFCGQPEHGEECFNFAKDNGLMPPEEIQRMEQERGIIKKLEQQGGGPGGCKGPEECRNYCMDTSHFDECAAFSVKEGMMSPDKAQIMLREFVDVGERKFEQFGPPGFVPQGFGPQQGQEFQQGPQQGQQGMMMGPSDAKFQERFKMFEQYQQGFQQRDDFCSKPENAEQCRQSGPGITGPMMPPQPGQPGEFPGQPPSNFGPAWTDEFMKEFKGEQFMPPEGQFRPPEGEMQYPYSGGQIPGQAPSGEMMPPSGQIPYQIAPPSGEQFAPQMMPGQMPPPMDSMMPPTMQPSTGEQAPPPPPSEPAPPSPSIEGPQSGTRLQSLLGTILYPLQRLLR